MLKKVFVYRGPLHTSPEGVTFGLYSSKEITKLSVVKIFTPLSFNALGHPLPGGLYDPKMGPYDNNGECGTCQQTMMYCPGHFGRIELPLPVINPLFSQTLLQILRLSCLGCFQLTLPVTIECLTVAQLKLLSLGYLQEAEDAEFLMADFIDLEGETGRKKTATSNYVSQRPQIKQRFDDYVDEILIKRNSTGKAVVSSKNLESLKHKVVKRVLGYAKMGNKCHSCGLACKKLMLYESKIVYTLVQKMDRSKQYAEEAFLTRFLDTVGRGPTEPVVNVQKYLTPYEAREHLRNTFIIAKDFLQYMFPVLNSSKPNHPTDLFFVDVIAVPPPKNRAAKIMNNTTIEHPQNLALRHVVQSCTMMAYVKLAQRCGKETLSFEARKAYEGIVGKTENEKLETTWRDLQIDVDHVMDREKSKVSVAAASQMIGLKQIIEKKEGLFRMNMMGKRVNYAARTVITPDPNIHIEEIGIPDVFAKVLTFPTVVTPWNVEKLRKMVMNGPDIHPGAIAVENQFGQLERLKADSSLQRIAAANRLLASDKDDGRGKAIKTVYRHLINGDYLLLNRQPSLHRPSIMAHKARVLYGDKVFRLHYANCKHYNADFDGDEMNAHFPQSHIARSEAANLVNVCSHFLVPKDGTPLSGLIQDHVVGGVRLTMRGRFFNRQDYHQLVNFAIGSHAKQIKTEPPTILKPQVLWSGKQVITSIVKNLVPEGLTPLTFTSSAKIKADEWRQCEATHWKYGGPIQGDNMSESAVIFRNGELLTGVLDKVHLGATPYGLIHAFYELYGNEAAGALLSAFSRLMTNFLQWEGFTLGVKDVLVQPKADESRRYYMDAASRIGPTAAAAGVSLSADASEDLVAEKLEQVHRSKDVKSRAFVDLCYKKALDQYTNQINKSCLPHGLVAIFPHNNLQLLVQSGAKGSTVNTMQMSCALGQIELEGKRPPLSVSGKSLPSFKAYDTSPRAGGFIAGRFLTGIRPQEFFFHCMAGREGLIDTAVKTSRSGYLQRCLVKLLEGVVTQYDGTVRDSDGSVIQFIYGEDGLDVCKSQYLKEKQLKFLEDNCKNFLDAKMLKRISDYSNIKQITDGRKKIREWSAANGVRTKKTRRGNFMEFSKNVSSSLDHLSGFNSATGRAFRAEKLCMMWNTLEASEKAKYTGKSSRCPDPLLSYLRPDCNLSVVSENLERIVEAQAERLGKGGEKQFKDMVYYKAMKALSTPGDAVGVLAAQSIGEPSTQMTLNTFHFAGRGEMNVTLGIPRLREILMVASLNIKTPSMDIPFLPHVSEERANRLKVRLTSVNMAQVLQEVRVKEEVDGEIHQARLYTMKFIFLSVKEYSDKFCVEAEDVLQYFETGFLRQKLLPALKRSSKAKKDTSIETVKDGAFHLDNDNMDNDDGNLDDKQDKGERGEGEEHESSDEEPEPEDADATQHTRRARQTEAGYDEPEDEERISEVDGDDCDDELDVKPDLSKLKVEPDEDMEYKDEAAEVRPSSKSAYYSSRVARVCELDDIIYDYQFDLRKEEWCQLTVKLPITAEKINIGSILKTVAEKSIIHQVANISRAFVVRTADRISLKTEGINILAMAVYRDLLDLNRLHCNNIHTMAEHYGIEAGSRVIVKEMTDVFKAYGIVIDPRHLSLIADFMTFSGTYRPFNRIGIESSASPLQQMSFETVVSFLRDATLTGKHDDLSNPSSRLVVGKPVGVGTGLFALRQKLNIFSV